MTAVDNWWDDHANLALTASFMDSQGGYSIPEDIIYMLEKPWKYDDEYKAAVKGLEDPRKAEEVGG